jgi:hypothetical protein
VEPQDERGIHETRYQTGMRTLGNSLIVLGLLRLIGGLYVGLNYGAGSEVIGETVAVGTTLVILGVGARLFFHWLNYVALVVFGGTLLVRIGMFVVEWQRNPQIRLEISQVLGYMILLAVVVMAIGNLRHRAKMGKLEPAAKPPQPSA